MDALPFAVAHGPEIWKVLVVLGGVAAILLLRLRARRRRAEAAAAVALPAPITVGALEHARRACIEGVLRAEPPIARIEDGAPAALSTIGGIGPRASWISARPARLVLETDGAAIAIEGASARPAAPSPRPSGSIACGAFAGPSTTRSRCASTGSRPRRTTTRCCAPPIPCS